jgi:predicted AlkP superfamily pyrophosphatase or phosphodiesterase
VTFLARFLVFLLALVPLPTLAQSAASPRNFTGPPLLVAPRPVTILVSIDGFRADYLARGITPNLSRLAANGAQGPMRPSFPSVTFPNHYTLVTGLRPDRHGIVGNTMEDARRPGETFTMATADPFWWNEAEPIWTTAERAGVRTATMFWPGSNLALGGIRPRDWWLYSKDNSEAQRVDAVIDWLRRPAETRPAFVTLYFDTVDTAGHKYGPDAEKTNDAIRAVDMLVGSLVDRVAGLGVQANFVIVADHGMAGTSPDKFIELWKIAKAKDYRAIGYGPVVGLIPMRGREARLAKALAKPHPNMTCAKKGELAPALHYGRNPRVPPYICIARIGWLIVTAPPPPDRPMEAGGAHGYDPANREMDALFIANGPAFRPGLTLPAFDNVTIYPLLAKLIGIAPRESDGSIDPVLAALR